MIWAITGGSGFVGRHLARRLLADGHSVRSLDLERGAPGVHARIGDIRCPDDVRWLVGGADVVVHAAAALPIRGSAQALRSVNVDGTRTVLEEAARAGVRRAILVSTAVVYGLQPPPVLESTAPAPIEAYGRTKLEGERIWRASAELETVILRPTAIVGPGRLGVFGILFDWIRENRRIYTIGSGANRYQLLAVEDLVDAILLAVERPVAGLVFNLGAEDVGTVAANLAALIDHVGSSSRLVALPAAPARLALGALALARVSPLTAWHYRSADRDVVVDTSAAARRLGWTPRFSNTEALARACDWYLANRGRLPHEAGMTHIRPWRQRALAFARRLS